LLISHLVPPVDALKITNEYETMLVMNRSSILKHAIRSLLKKKMLYHNAVLSRILELRSSIRRKYHLENIGKPTFLVRVDEFPQFVDSSSNTSHFLEFHKILSKHEIPYLLSVTPFPSRKPLVKGFEEYREIDRVDLEILKELVHSGVEIAMHGIAHQTIDRYRYTEIVGVPGAELEQKILRGVKKLQSEGLETEIFIPPFNTFDLPSLRVLARHFKVICGGPESVLYVGLRFSPSFLSDTLYVPSYSPAYGRAREMLPFIEEVKSFKDYVIVPLALHWSWEAKNDFADIDGFCRAIKGETISWTSFVSDASEMTRKMESRLILPKK